MNLIVASKGGFCFGVKKAIDTALKTSYEINDKSIFTFGPIIHNSHVIKYLDDKGIKVVEDIEEAKDQILIVRSHGVPFDFYEKAEKLNIKVVDTTCPFVRKVQNLAKKHWELGNKVIILGDSKHPEVIGINGWAKNEAIIIQSELDVQKLINIKDQKACILAQTTFPLKKWDHMVHTISEVVKNYECFNTICSATLERQEECEIIAKKVDCMIVVGGRNSSNTQKLYEISKKYCKNAVHIESVCELVMNNIVKYDSIGIVAGASTPEWIIQEIIDKLEK